MIKEKENVKTKYTKKQIQESIKYWENQLKKMNEAVDGGIDSSFVQSCAKSLKNMQKALGDLETVRTSKSFDKMPLGFKKDFDKLLDMSRAIETMIAICEQQKVAKEHGF